MKTECKKISTIKNLDKIIEPARKRMLASSHSPHMVYAEIFFMTESELDEFFMLRREAINFQGGRADAEERIRQKIKNRNLNGSK